MRQKSRQPPGVFSQRPAGRALHKVGKDGSEKTGGHLFAFELPGEGLSHGDRRKRKECSRQPLRAKAGPFLAGGAVSPFQCKQLRWGGRLA